MVQIYFAGGEDIDFINVGGGAATTSTSFFRSTYARCALQPTGVSGYYQNAVPFSASTFWFTGRHGANGNWQSNQLTVGFADANSVRRLRIRNTASSASGPWAVEKISAAGVVTQLGSNTSWTQSGVGVIDKFDIYINYSTLGQFTVYLNGAQVFSYSGDVTTDGVTSLAGVQLLNDNGGGSCGWSEIIVSDSDTRSMSLQTLAPVANGNTHNFDTGSPAAANVNEITLNDGTLDGSSVAGQIDEYTIPAMVSGTFSILAVGMSARMRKGLASGPSKMDLGVRQAAADYWSADLALAPGWATSQNWWMADPSTSIAWAALPVNIGLRSVA